MPTTIFSLQLSSLVTLQDWATRVDLQNFDVLLCIGNKVDLVPGHPVHMEYRKLLQKQRLKDSSIDYSDTAEYGISETEGSSLLGDEDSSWETRRSCLEWCIERNIEFLEACASNADFDQCKILVLLLARMLYVCMLVRQCGIL